MKDAGRRTTRHCIAFGGRLCIVIGQANAIDDLG